MDLLGGMSRYVSVPLAAVGVSLLVLRGTLPPRRARPARAQRGLRRLRRSPASSPTPTGAPTAKGLVVPSMPLNREAVLVAVATVGTTLAPWGLAFIQSYAVDKRLTVKDLALRADRRDRRRRAHRRDRPLRRRRLRRDPARPGHRDQRRRATRRARSSRWPAALAATLFGLGFLGAALLAAAIVPLSTAYSVSEAFGRQADLDDSFDEAPLFYLSFGVVVVVAAALVLIPGAPLIPILFLSQALNAVLLLVLLPFMRSLGRDRELMGEHALGRGGRLDDRHRPRP